MTRAEAMARDLRDLASLLAGTIRRVGAAYGSAGDWRRDIQQAVHIMERNHLLVAAADRRAKARMIAAVRRAKETTP